jgi:rod shape determining protein RodA
MNINKKLFKSIDYNILLSEILLIIIGIITIGSASGGGRPFKMQIAWFVLSFILGFFIILLDYNTIGGFYKALYFLSIFLLLLVLVIGSVRNGAKAWLGVGSLGIQPSEFAKLTTIITVAKLMEEMENINTFKNLTKLAFYILLPMALIQLQPDTGTNLIFAVTMLGMLFVAGLDMRFIYGTFIAAASAIAVVWQFNIIKPYQKDRILVFLRPELDRLGAGYNAVMAKIAIASGMFFGVGYNKGNLSGGNFIPE